MKLPRRPRCPIKPKSWGAYELNHALVLALDRPDAQAVRKQGQDPLAEAAADLELREAMAAGFDEMRC